MKVDADVESAVIPIGVMVAAPLPVRLELIDGVIDLAAVFTMLRGCAIDSGLICFEPAMAIVVVVVVGKSHLGGRVA